MAAALLNLPRNFSLYTIPVAWVLSLGPHIFATTLGKFDNRYPRTYVKSLDADQTLDKSKKNLITRCEGAQSNGFENLGLFAAAVVMGNVAKLDNTTLNNLSAAYIATRVVYNYVYIGGTTQTLATARSLAYISGIGIIMSFFIKSANALKDSL